MSANMQTQNSVGQGVTFNPSEMQALQTVLLALQRQGGGQVGGQGTGIIGQRPQLDPQSFWSSISDFVTGAGQQLLSNPQVQQAAGGFLQNILSIFANDPAGAAFLRQQAVSGRAYVGGVAPQGIFDDIGNAIGSAANWVAQNVGPIAQQAAPVIVQNLPFLLSLFANQPRQQQGQIAFQPQGLQPGQHRSWN
jgi:hypothetical protein